MTEKVPKNPSTLGHFKDIEELPVCTRTDLTIAHPHTTTHSLGGVEEMRQSNTGVWKTFC